ncbi:MAG: YceI family protein [Bacteroidetes bacterium]|nr:YceI family protein [Bacteroidota bacterium]
MKKLSLIAILIAAFSLSFTLVPQTTWTYDSNHAKVGFSATHMMVSDVEGYFKKATATLTSTKADFTDAVVEMTADANSIFTDNDMRDSDLKGTGFFEVEKYPNLSFKSFYFKKTKTPNTYFVKGNLTMHGVTKPVSLTAIARMGTNPMSKKTIAGFKITGKLKRTDFGIGPNVPTAIVADEIIIDCNAEFIKN